MDFGACGEGFGACDVDYCGGAALAVVAKRLWFDASVPRDAPF